LLRRMKIKHFVVYLLGELVLMASRGCGTATNPLGLELWVSVIKKNKVSMSGLGDVDVSGNRRRLHRNLLLFDAVAAGAGALGVYGMYQGAKGNFEKFRKAASQNKKEMVAMKRKMIEGHGSSKSRILSNNTMATQTDSSPAERMYNGRSRSLYKARRRVSVRKVRRARRAPIRVRNLKGGRKTRSVAGKSLAGGRSLVGSPDEEDAQVKSHMKKGIVLEFGNSGVVASTGTGNHAGYIVHATFPQLIHFVTT